MSTKTKVLCLTTLSTQETEDGAAARHACVERAAGCLSSFIAIFITPLSSQVQYVRCFFLKLMGGTDRPE